ncbi:hypothetical protein EJ08DRAFT_672993 [Tothia fuscella]|uniref:Glucose-methanol-choline oxidoreductase C-terminal domain-containing protein n=1 Tax=Tothia fuscella TaxID=1048955 RepID=A0A9P4TTK2_9PEZI|nr:hypothetical protein EJ08DRAFT_672993 [Tothia fuscella]
MNAHDKINKAAPLQADVLIVGSGLIGAVYARTIIDDDPNINVLMVELGKQETRLIGDHKKNSNAVQGCGDINTSVHESVIDHGSAEQQSCHGLPAAPIVREVGGMGSYWSCAIPEQHPTIERSDILTNDEWIILHDHAKTLFDSTDTAFNHSIRHRWVKDTLVRAHQDRTGVNLPLACKRNIRGPECVRWTSPATVLGGLADPELLIDESSRRVVGAEITDLQTNKVFIAKARKYIICAGVVLTAGILFNSDIRAETGYAALGRYLTEQTMAVCQVVMSHSLMQSMWNDPRCHEHITIPISIEHPWHTQIQRDLYYYNTIPTSVDPRLILDLRFFGYVKPVYHNYVEFSSQLKDQFGMPQPIVHYRVTKADTDRAQAMMRNMKTTAAILGDYLPGGEPRFLAAGAATHICGTTRVGKEDDGHSVVDRHSKVWRLSNLCIGGCGVIETQNACNPTLTAACFAIVGVRKVVEEIHALNHQTKSLE